MLLVVMIFAAMGFLSPANRGGLMTATLMLFVFMGVISGYASSRLYLAMKGQDWKTNVVLTATLYPGITFLLFIILNFVIWGEKSSGAVPFGTIFALVALWFGVSVPLTFGGAYCG